MELLTGDRLVPNPSDFPEHISPIPAIGDLLFSNPTSILQPSGANRHNFPPQKLRPVRGNGGRAPSNTQANNHFPRHVDGTFESLGLCEFSSECFETTVKVEAVDVAASVGVSGANDPDQNLFEEDESSSSSDNDSLSMAVEDSVNRKRKRKRREKIEEFLGSLVKKVMEKQEQMHQQLIDMIDRRERERIIREEAWKEKEMERIKREEKIREQETSRSLALISFIENVLGRKSEFLQPSTTAQSEDNGSKDEGTTPMRKGFKCEESDTNNKRWAEVEVQVLIMLRTALEQRLLGFGSKGSNVWDEISAGMHTMGYNRTAKKCKEKWENIKKYNKKPFANGGLKLHNNGACPVIQEPDLQDSDLSCKSGTKMN